MTISPKSSEKEQIQQFLTDFHLPSPRKIFEQIQQAGYIGQEHALRAASLMAFRHINRLKKIYLDQVDPRMLPRKDNYLLIGPTGCGKTYLIELLFRDILKIPTVIIDITSYSETGYVGQDAVSMITRLIYAANRNKALASIGIICIDEFDKLSSGKNNAVFSGAGTTKDVSGLGVQRELLKMLEGGTVDVPMQLSHASYGERVTFHTHHLAFIACGAFSGFKRLIQSSKHSIGYGQKSSADAVAVSLDKSDIDKVAYFEAYGLMPELIGRFSRIIPFRALTENELKQILEKNTLAQYRKELNLEQVNLIIDQDVVNKIVKEAARLETGARALNYALNEHLEHALFELYSSPFKPAHLRLMIEGDEIKWEFS